jgi:2-oxo-4-hydroxy-4-carboxy-5-ureidoimidazoline decarboxylase
MTLPEANALSRQVFVARFGDVAEHSAWVAERAEPHRPFPTRLAMVEAFQREVGVACEAEQLALLRAHPDLAGRAALAPDSAREQAGAGLDSLTAEELAQFHELNARYVARFGFPFILAVKGAGKAAILAAFEQRIGGGVHEERMTALAQVMRIIRFRIEERVDG